MLHEGIGISGPTGKAGRTIDRSVIAAAMAPIQMNKAGSFEMRSLMGWKTDQDKTYPAKIPSEWTQLYVPQIYFHHWQSAFVQHAG